MNFYDYYTSKHMVATPNFVINKQPKNSCDNFKLSVRGETGCDKNRKSVSLNAKAIIKLSK